MTVDQCAVQWLQKDARQYIKYKEDKTYKHTM